MLKKRTILTISVIGVVLTLAIVFFMRIAPFLYQLFWEKTIAIKKKDDAVNVLILGIGGGTHEGPELTDTIIFANIDIAKNVINLFAIPRDLWIPQLNAKINATYALGNNKDAKGLFLTKSVVQDIVGTQIHYVAVIDFQGFVQLVDHLGGIDVEVKKTLDDYQYPIAGKEQELCGRKEEELPILATSSSELEAFPCRYKHIRFEKGTQHMNGEIALEYVRSRHAKGEEGTDTARSERQQQVILAMREKLLSLQILLNPVKLVGAYNIIKDHINTNADPSEYDDFIKLARKMEKASVKSYVIHYANEVFASSASGDEEDNKEGLLINPQPSEAFGYQWILIPRIGNGKFEEIQKYVSCIEQGNECVITKDGIEKKQPISTTPQQ